MCFAALTVGVAFSAVVPPQITHETATQRKFLQRLSAAAIERTAHTVRYDPAYIRIGYPGGDVPANTGVCTDEVIRAYRELGIDLQKAVHEDMQSNFRAYPNKSRWALAHTDTNIDHRRVPNLRVFFTRKGESLPITASAADYAPGELVTWDLGGGVGHIGMVVDRKAANGRIYGRPQHRPRPEARRRALRLENHRPLPLLRPPVRASPLDF
jgi:hypothetical protein